MKKFIIVTEKVKRLIPHPDFSVQTPTEFIKNTPNEGNSKKTKVINLCSEFEYLSKGYYVSLLAEARALPCIPSVAEIVTLNWKRNYELYLPEINQVVSKYFKEEPEDPLLRGYTTYFGRHDNPKVEPISRKLFDLFRCPALFFEIKWTEKKWEVVKIEPVSYASIEEDRIATFNQALETFTGTAWKADKQSKKSERYWVGILHNPKEEHPPSNTAALKKFIKVGKKMGIWVELITKADHSSLLEFDAIFIRETTGIDNYTYKVARKALAEGIPCIDDAESIMGCCNKVYMHELLVANGLKTPKTDILDKNTIQSKFTPPLFPVVLKIPDGSFSKGIERVYSREDFQKKATEMLKKSEIILMQEFVESEFDWRVGVLNHEVIYVVKYFMAKGHWQIYNHSAKLKSEKSGDSMCVPLEEVDPAITKVALDASALIGNGLYGVDLKQTKTGEVVVIEINDNPNIDSGVEDELLGDKLYEKILKRVVELIEE